MPLASNIGIFHPGWSRAHAPIARASMTAEVQITDPTAVGTEPHWDDQLEEMIPGEPAPLAYDGPARIQEIDSVRDGDAAGEAVTQRRYLVALDFDAPRVEVGWPVLVTQARNDADLVGRTLHIADVMHGSERWQRDLICTIQP